MLYYLPFFSLLFLFLLLLSKRKKIYSEFWISREKKKHRKRQEIKYFLDDLTLWFERYLHFVMYILQMNVFFVWESVCVCVCLLSFRLVFIFILIAFHWKLNRHPMYVRCWAQNRNECVRLFSWHNLIEWWNALRTILFLVHKMKMPTTTSHVQNVFCLAHQIITPNTGLFPFGMFITIVNASVRACVCARARPRLHTLSTVVTVTV